MGSGLDSHTVTKVSFLAMSRIEIKGGSPMSGIKQTEIAAIASHVCSGSRDATRIASALKQRLDERYPRYWHVSVGRDFVNCSEHIDGDEMMMYYDHLCIQVWRCGPKIHR